MTAIVALRDGNTIWMGGDSAGVGGWDLEVRADPKVFTVDDYIFGFSDSFRAGQIMQYDWKPPEHDPSVPLDKFMYTTFLSSVRKVMKDGGMAQVSENVESAETGMAIGYRKKLYILYSDFQLAIPSTPYATLGCGGDLARGSMYTTQKLTDQFTPRERIKLALKAAEAGSVGVRGPFRIIKLETK